MSNYGPIEGSINKLADADRATIQALASTYTHDKQEMIGWLYELVAAAYVLRDRDLMMKVLDMLCKIQGWYLEPAPNPSL